MMNAVQENHAQPRAGAKAIALAAPALFAPVALLFPWALVPGHLGASLAGPAVFFHWLTKYPNFGPVNFEVFAGIACLVGAALIPPALAIYRLAGGRRRAVIVALALAALAVYLPVLSRLDLTLASAAIIGLPTMAGPVTEPQALGGPLVRGLALLSALILSGRVLRHTS